MAFEIGDKVLTSAGLYISGEWRERGLKGKVVDVSQEYGGLITVKFKGIEELRFLRPEYLILRNKKKERKRPFKVGATVALAKDVHSGQGWHSAGADAEVIELIPDSNLVRIQFLNGGELSVVEEALTKTEVVEDKPAEGPEEPRPFEVGDSVVFTKDYGNESLVAAEGTYAEVVEVLPHGEVLVEFDDYTTEVVPEDVLAVEQGYDDEEEPADSDFKLPEEKEHSPEVLGALNQILRNIEEIKTLLTTQPKSEVHFTIHPSNGLTEEEVAEALQKEEEPAPEPVFKKAKEVKAGDLLATEAGVWDKVDRIDTKASGYTSLYGVFGNRIAQVPSGRVVQVLEEVS